MAAQDIVVDTNILVTCDNPGDTRFSDARAFMLALQKSATTLVVDRGAGASPQLESSLIGSEYLKHLRFGTIAYVVMQDMVLKQRVKFHETCSGAHLKKKVNQLIRNKRDRTFLIIAIETADKLLVSHDYEDFSVAKRGSIRKDFGVAVIESDVALPQL